MRKTFCDRCGGQCVNTVFRLHGEVEHHTNQGEQVGFDQLKPVELCSACYEPVRDMLGLAILPMEFEAPVMARDVPR